MFLCVLCRWPVVLDDVLVAHIPTGRCVCLHCYLLAIEDVRPMGKVLTRETREALYSTTSFL